jgi:hypothetical protein
MTKWEYDKNTNLLLIDQAIICLLSYETFGIDPKIYATVNVWLHNLTVR